MRRFRAASTIRRVHRMQGVFRQGNLIPSWFQADSGRFYPPLCRARTPPPHCLNPQTSAADLGSEAIGETSLGIAFGHSDPSQRLNPRADLASGACQPPSWTLPSSFFTFLHVRERFWTHLGSILDPKSLILAPFLPLRGPKMIGKWPGGKSTTHLGSWPGGKSTTHLGSRPGGKSTTHLGSWPRPQRDNGEPTTGSLRRVEEPRTLSSSPIRRQPQGL